MADNKTKPTELKVVDFLETVEPEKRRKEGQILHEVFQKATGAEVTMWGGNIIGYGSYHYIYESGREGDMPCSGFSPRKSKLSLYIMGDQNDMRISWLSWGSTKLESPVYMSIS